MVLRDAEGVAGMRMTLGFEPLLFAAFGRPACVLGFPFSPRSCLGLFLLAARVGKVCFT